MSATQRALLLCALSSAFAAASQQTYARDTNFVRSAVSGGVAAAAATVALHPVDTVKTLLQQGGGSAALRGLGVRGLYKGVVPAAFSMMPACAVRMGAYEAIKAQLLRRNERLSPETSVVLASALSVVVSSSVRSPLDMIKTQVQAGSARSVGAALSAAWGAGGLLGVRSFYRGAGLALLRDVPFFSINLLAYEQLKNAALAKAAARNAAAGSSLPPVLSNREAICIGAAAQGFAGFTTNPMDALKTRVQAGSSVGFGAAFRSVLRESGPAGFMRGAGMRLIWIAPQGCVYYPVYELTQRVMTPRA